MTSEHESEWRPSSAAELRGKGVHRATLPSGERCLVRFPALGVLALADAIPEEVREMAVRDLTHPRGAGGSVDEEVKAVVDNDAAYTLAVQRAAELTRFWKWLVAEHTLVEPRLTVEQLAEIDERDLDWLINVATRNTDSDARGVRLGVMSIEDMAVFRDAHGCADDCADCARAQAERSSPRLVQV